MKSRWEMVWQRAKAAGIRIGFVNLIGGNDGVILDGASISSDGHGRIILQAPPFEEFVETVDLDCGIPDARCLPGDDIETVRQALVLGIRDYARKNNFTKVVFGLSGGLDSAVVAALAADALGAENVLAVMMPSPYSSRGSIDDSVDLGQRLRSEEHTSELQSPDHLVCRLLLEKKKNNSAKLRIPVSTNT